MKKILAFWLVFSLGAAHAQSVGPTPGGGSGGTPGGSTLQLQYNNAGAFGGMSGTSWDDTNRALTITGATITASTPILSMTQTWNNAAALFKGILFNVTNTASNSSSDIIDLQVGGVSQFRVNRLSGVFASNVTTLGQLILPTNGIINWTDLFITRSGAASVRFGLADAAAPVAQTIGVQNVVAGTSNTAGVDWTHKGSLSTGSGVGGDIIFQTSAANAAATTQNAGVAILTLKGSATTTANPGRIMAQGQIESAGSQPTAAGSGGTCATGAVAGGANAGTVTLTGACAAANTVTLTFLTASSTGWSCFASDRTLPTALLYETSTSTTTAVLTVSGATTGATDVLQYACTAY